VSTLHRGEKQVRLSLRWRQVGQKLEDRTIARDAQSELFVERRPPVRLLRGELAIRIPDFFEDIRRLTRDLAPLPSCRWRSSARRAMTPEGSA
jgi:hypothetical protein